MMHPLLRVHVHGASLLDEHVQVTTELLESPLKLAWDDRGNLLIGRKIIGFIFRCLFCDPVPLRLFFFLTALSRVDVDVIPERRGLF
jgi:hypothetical protein